MPDSTHTEEPEELVLCTRCEEQEHACTCIYCDNCGEYVEHGCECIICRHCETSFLPGQNMSCARCQYCATCIQRGRVEHYSCTRCLECRDEESRSCSECGHHECCATFSCREDECYQCDDCCTCIASSPYIKSYTCKEYPYSKPLPDTVPRSFLYLGVECETEADEAANLEDIAETIHSAHEHEILMKEDGSLAHGIELVTGKYSLEAHKDLWPRLCKTALTSGLRSWKHKSTGLHVHMSRRFLSALDIGKILVFINSDNEAIRSSIRRLAGRGANHYCQVQKKKLTDVYNREERYEAVNLTNAKTIEIRIFKGTLNAKHILADIEFCHALAYWVKETSTQDIEKWQRFWQYVSKHTKLYRNLIEYLCPQQLMRAEIEEPDSAQPQTQEEDC